jgi:hypothetical protein
MESWYEIHLQGHLDPRWASWFDGMTLTADHGTTELRGPVADQAALHGLLTRLRDLGLPLLSVVRIEPDPDQDPHQDPHQDPDPEPHPARSP